VNIRYIDSIIVQEEPHPNEYRVERLFNRLKSRVHIAPLFVKLNEQIEGLTYLLTLGVRV